MSLNNPISLELGLIGNGSISALVTEDAKIVWSCVPRFDGDPVFCQLLNDDPLEGAFSIELQNHMSASQRYLPHTAVLETRLVDASGSGVVITDFCPRFEEMGRMFRPMMIVRLIEPVGEAPQVRVRLRPRFDYGRNAPTVTRGSNHVRFVGDGLMLRLSTNAPITYLLDEKKFYVDRPYVFFLGPDESFRSPLLETAYAFRRDTTQYWQQLCGRLQLPLEWQEAVTRSAITLKLCTFEETGAIIASPTTSLPEVDGEGRNWDYRYCWLRDAFFVVRTLNKLGYVETMEGYIDYLTNVVARSRNGYLQPLYGIGLERSLIEKQVTTLDGYRGNKPVRVGNQAYEHDQHDGYGSVILAVARAFFDSRLKRPAGEIMFQRLEQLGNKAFEFHNVPDAGLWEFRTIARVHTHSALMCWAACDRLYKIAEHLGKTDRAEHWLERAEQIRELIDREAWNEELQSFVASFGGDEIDASLLLMQEVGYLAADDPRFAGTVAAVERELKRGPHVFRYKNADDFGEPKNAFIICTFWYISALASLGRYDEARGLFEHMLACRNRLGLLSEDIDRSTDELWGNFPQTYSHVGLIECAMKLSRDWDDVV